MLPNFFVIGAMKAGTSSLWEYLRSHPQVAVSSVKEPFFFCDNRGNWGRGLEWYEGLFPAELDGFLAVGEASTAYAKFPHHPRVAQKISRHVPWAKFIYLLREPVKRMQSHYLHQVREGFERRPVERALVESNLYLDTSRYAYQLQQYLEHFPLDRVCLITSEGLKARRLETMRRVWSFLGVAEDWIPPNLNEEYNRSEGRQGYRPAARRFHDLAPVFALARRIPSPLKQVTRPLTMRSVPAASARISDDLRDRLREALAEDVAQLRPYMGDGFDGWGIA